MYTPIENIIGCDLDVIGTYTSEYLAFCSKIKETGMKPVQFHQQKLGKQLYCINNGEFRFWCWEMKNWRVLVSNSKGICFEVLEDATKELALESWSHYRDAV